MKIKTAYYPPPIPIRNHDWCAWDDDTFDADWRGEEDGFVSTSPQGWGYTEAEAIQNLMEQIAERA